MDTKCSYKKFTLPANIAGINCFIDIELVKEKIPLLLSKSSLKKDKSSYWHGK